MQLSPCVFITAPKIIWYNLHISYLLSFFETQFLSWSCEHCHFKATLNNSDLAADVPGFSNFSQISLIFACCRFMQLVLFNKIQMKSLMINSLEPTVTACSRCLQHAQCSFYQHWGLHLPDAQWQKQASATDPVP